MKINLGMKNKKGISELISYVLLITLALAMAGGVYAYLRFYAENPLPEEQCDGISIAIENYVCEDDEMTITIKNTGRFTCSAKVKLYDSQGMIVGEVDIPEEATQQGQIIQEIKIGEAATGLIGYDIDVVRIEVIPFKFDKEEHYTKFCPEAKIVQEIEEGCEFSGTVPIT